MLEGLEISEVRLNNVLHGVETLRLDSEYYNKKYINAEIYIKNNSHKFINFIELGLNVDGSAFYPALEPYYNLGKYPFIRVGDVKEYVDFDNCIKVPLKILHRYPTLKHCKKGDIVLTKGGTVGLAGLITQDCCVTRDLIFINSSILKEEDSICLFLFLSTNFAYYQLIRSSSQSVQPHLTITLVKDIFIYKYSHQIKLKATEIYKKSVKLTEKSKTLYHQAEQLLLDNIGLKNFKLSNNNTNIKSFKKSFSTTGRLDAEYYLPKYEEIENKIKKNNQVVILDDILQKIDTGEYSENYYIKNTMQNLSFYIRSKNIKKGLVEIDDNYFVPQILFKKFSQKGDIVTARVGSVGLFGTIRSELAGSVYSDNILCFRLPNNYIPEVYTLLFNTIYYFELIDKLARGSVQQRLNQETLKDLIIPIIDYDTQMEISTLIEKSFKLRKESEKLLEDAKLMVEKEIEGSK